MAFPCNRTGIFANEEIHIRAKMGLLNMINVKLGIATRVMRGIGCPCGTAQAQFGVGHQQLQHTISSRHADTVARFNQGQRAACLGFGRNMQNHRAIGRTGHPGIGDADHVAHTLFHQRRRDRHIANFGHTGIAFGAAAF